MNDAYSVRFSAALSLSFGQRQRKGGHTGRRRTRQFLAYSRQNSLYLRQNLIFMESLLLRKRIKAFRLSAGLSTLDVAEAIGLDKTTYERFERGAQKTLDFNLVVKIAPVLGKHYIELFPEEDVVNTRLKTRSAALVQTGITIEGSNTELTPEAAQLRSEHWELLTEQAATNRQQATIIELLMNELVSLRKELSVLRGGK